MRIFKKRGGLLANKKGNVLMIGAAAMPLVIGSAALAVDTVQLSLWKRQLQRSADSAALAGAYALAQSKDYNASALAALDLNDSVPLSGSPTIQSSPTAGPYTGNPRAVRVVLASERSLPFMSFFLAMSPRLEVEATAALVYTGKYCVVSLEEGTQTGITFSGNTTTNLGCGVISNSRAASAVVADGSARVTASPVAGVGGVPTSTAYVQPTLLLPYSLPQPDPFANLPNPPPNPCTGSDPAANVAPNTSATLEPGCYRGMDLRGTVTLNPGTYYVDGSQFRTSSQARVTGSGVTIILTSSTPTDPSSFATISMNGGATVDLTAPESGTYQGVLFYQDPRAVSDEELEDIENGRGNQINGDSSSRFQGAFYFPRQHLTFNGNTGMNTNCLQLVARRMTFSGNSRINNSCPSDSGSNSFDATWVRLVH